MASAPQIVGIGVDCVEIARVRAIGAQQRFAEYFLREQELPAVSRARDAAQFIASRFAAKEAVIKAFPGYLSPHDFEIVMVGKKPTVRFRSEAHAQTYDAFVSITHGTDVALGYAIVTQH